MESFPSGSATPLQPISPSGQPDIGHPKEPTSTSRDTNLMDPLNGSSSTAVTNSDLAPPPTTPPQHGLDPTLSKQDPKSSLGSEADESDGSGPDYYTSDSEEDEDPYFEDQFSEKQKAKRVRLRAERDDIKPSYYYGEREAEEDALSKGASKPQLKRKGLRGVPVFEPRMDQFEDFYGYINKIDRWGMRSGIIKIIPPKEWSSQLPHLGQESLRTDGKGQMLKQARIKSPISQVIQGNRGLFRVMNVTKRKNYNALEWYDLANSVEHRPPDFFTPPEQSTPAGTQEGPDPSFRSTRSTRSSRRHTTQVTPILSKQAVSRKRKTPLPSNLDQTAGSPTASTSDLKSTPLTPNITPSISDSPIKPTAPNSDSVVGPTMSAINATPLSANSVSHGQSHMYARLDSPSPVPDSNIHYTPSQATVNTVEGASKDPINPIEGTPKAEVTSPDVAKPNVNQADCPSGTAHTVLQVDSNMPDSIVSACPEMTESQAADQDSTSAKKLKRVGPLPPSDEEWAQFVTCYDKLPYGAQKSDYTYKACRIIEQEYWRTIGNGGEPMYGADTTGSLFDERTKHWNVANLDNLLNRLKLKKKIPGVNTPYLYFGAWRATFAWHVEDADLYSINYIHFGAPKYWYSIPQEHNERFESFMASSFAKERFTCPQFLRHKAFLASPAVLASCGIQLNRVVHLPGEIIITYPYGYHSGFNLGYNCAESVNFANEDWIEKGKKAKFCKCISDAVTINVDAWLHEHEEALKKETETERKNAEKAERAEQKRKRESDPKLPATKKPKPLADPDKVPKKKIKSHSAIKLSGSQDNLHNESPSNIANQAVPDSSKAPNSTLVKLPTKKIKAEGEISKAPSNKISKLKASSKKVFPCALCPDLSEDNLVRILDEPQVPKAMMPAPGVDLTSQLVQPFSTTSTTFINTTATSPEGAALAQIPSAVAPSCVNPDLNSLVIDPAIISSAVGAPPHVPVASQSQTNESLPVKSNASAKPKPIRRAHKICCMFIPSTWIDQLDTGEEVARGVGTIEKARWALKCQLCNEKMGAKVQCTKTQKCAKACHVTCALKTGLFFIDAQLSHGEETYSLLEPPPNGYPPDLDLEQDQKVVVLCKQHNPEYQRAEAERKSKELADKIAGFMAGESIKVKTNKGVFQVFFHSRNPEKQTLRVTFEDGHASDMPYSRVYFGPKSVDEAGKSDIQGQQASQPSKSKASDGLAASAAKKRKTSSSMPSNPATMIHPELYTQAPLYQSEPLGYHSGTFDHHHNNSHVTSLQAGGSSSRSSVASGMFALSSPPEANPVSQPPSWHFHQPSGEPGRQIGLNTGPLSACNEDKLLLLANISTAGAHVEPTLQSTGANHLPLRKPNQFIDPRFQT